MKSRPIKKRSEFRFFYKQYVGLLKTSQTKAVWLKPNGKQGPSMYVLSEWLTHGDKGIEVSEKDALEIVKRERFPSFSLV
jgi:hypothetical protein